MAGTVKLKRSAVEGKIPTTSDLDLGEMAINTHDGKVYIKKDDGTAAIVEIGGLKPLAAETEDFTFVSADEMQVNNTYLTFSVVTNSGSGTGLLDVVEDDELLVRWATGDETFIASGVPEEQSFPNIDIVAIPWSSRTVGVYHM